MRLPSKQQVPGTQMAYSDGNTPELGDRVRNLASGKIGRVANVQLGAGNTPGHDQISVEPEDGSVGGVLALADEFELVERGQIKW